MTLLPVPRVAIVIVAAGSGTRLGAGVPKAFVGIDAHSVLSYAVRGAAATTDPAQLVVVVPEGLEGEAETIARSAAGERAELVTVVVGGASRQASVARGLEALWGDVELVLVHDAARALTPPEVFERVVARVRETGSGVIPVLPVIDTITRVEGESVAEGLDRSSLAAVQTPQGFPRAVLVGALARAEGEYTDDATAVAAAGTPVVTVPGDERAFKITLPDDLSRARRLLGSPRTPRVGIGTDVHRFGEGEPLWLAGLEWLGEKALSGHSDGDAVVHAIVDALLSAAGLGDIGTLFGTDDPELEGAHAPVFLTRTRERILQAGFAIGNVSVQVQAKRPRFSPRRLEAERVLSALLDAPVSVSATTTDGLGFVGKGKGVLAIATALLLPAE